MEIQPPSSNQPQPSTPGINPSLQADVSAIKSTWGANESSCKTWTDLQTKFSDVSQGHNVTPSIGSQLSEAQLKVIQANLQA